MVEVCTVCVVRRIETIDVCVYDVCLFYACSSGNMVVCVKVFCVTVVVKYCVLVTDVLKYVVYLYKRCDGGWVFCL